MRDSKRSIANHGTEAILPPHWHKCGNIHKLRRNSSLRQRMWDTCEERWGVKAIVGLEFVHSNSIGAGGIGSGAGA